MSSTAKKILNNNITSATLLLFFVMLVHSFIFEDQSSYANPDEIIVVEVVKNLNNSNSLDANWALADLPGYFKYDQYNFTSYIYFVYFSQKIASLANAKVFVDENAYKFSRALSKILFVLIIFLVFFLAKEIMPTEYALVAAVITLLSIQLQQDSLYARPETFFSALVLIICLLLTKANQRPVLAYGLSGFIFGILLACKISALFLAPFIAIILITQYRNSLLSRDALLIAGLLCGTTLLGIVAGNPYVILNFDGWMNGVMYLLNQYNGSHLPHGLPDASALGQFLHASEYLAKTNGVISLFFFIGAAYAIAQRHVLLSFFCAMVIINIVYFSIKPVFFERNISHLMPLFYIIAAFGVARITSLFPTSKMRTILQFALVSIVLITPVMNINLLKKAINPDSDSHSILDTREQLQKSYDSKIDYFGYLLSPASVDSLIRQAKSSESLIYEIHNPGDLYTKKNVTELLRKGYFSIAWEHDGVFAEFPPSTLQTYLNNGTIFLLKNEEKLGFKIDGFEKLNNGQWKSKNSGMQINLEGAWQPDAYYPDTPAPKKGHMAFGSWNGNDSNIGELVAFIPDGRCNEISLGYLTGPDPSTLDIMVIDTNTKAVLNRLDLRVPNNEWTHVTGRELFNDNPCKNLAVVARDNGVDWGQWLAITLYP